MCQIDIIFHEDGYEIGSLNGPLLTGSLHFPRPLASPSSESANTAVRLTSTLNDDIEKLSPHSSWQNAPTTSTAFTCLKVETRRSYYEYKQERSTSDTSSGCEHRQSSPPPNFLVTPALTPRHICARPEQSLSSFSNGLGVEVHIRPRTGRFVGA
jgi:hypothetical protein